MLKKFLILTLIITSIGCSTTQQRVTKLKNKDENTISFKLHCNLEQAKTIVRKVANDLKLIEREFGTEDVKEKDDNFILITNNRLSYGILSFIVGGFIWSPINLGVFFDYNEDSNMTTVTISEEVSTFGLKKRNELYWRIQIISLEMAKRFSDNKDAFNNERLSKGKGEK